MNRLINCALAAGLLALGSAPADRSPSFGVIINAGNPTSDISAADLRDVLLGARREWPNHRRITVVQRDRGTAVAEVVTSVLGMSVREYARRLLQQEFQGNGALPLKIMASDGGVCEFVSNAPGAIGFVPPAALELPLCRSSVRILTVNHLPRKGSR